MSDNGSRQRVLDRDFVAVLQKSPNPGGWTYVVMPGSAEYFGTRSLVKVRGTIEGRGLPRRPARRGRCSMSGSPRCWPPSTPATGC